MNKGRAPASPVVLVCCLSITFFCVALHARESKMDDLARIVKGAVTYTLAADYRVDTDIPDGSMWKRKTVYARGGMFRVEIQQLRNIGLTCIIKFSDSDDRYLWMQESDGTCRSSVVISSSIPLKGYITQINEMASDRRLSRSQLSVSNTTFNGKPCRRIFIRHPCDDKTIATSPAIDFNISSTPIYTDDDPEIYKRNVTEDEFAADPESFRAVYYAAHEIIVGNDPGKPFIYYMAIYNPAGEVISDFDHRNVRFDEPMDDDMFQPPKSAKIIKAGTVQEIGNIYFDRLTPPQPSAVFRWAESVYAWLCGVWSKVVAWFGALGNMILNAPPLVLLLPAATCVPAAIFIKKIGRRKAKPILHRPNAASKGPRRN